MEFRQGDKERGIHGDTPERVSLQISLSPCLPLSLSRI
jgi:hypothetical protein